MSLTKILLFGILWTVAGYAQFDPEDAQVISYLPQLADGGPVSQQWITSFTFVNPHATLPLNGSVFLYGNNGSSLLLDFGAGPVSTFNFTIPPQGTVVFTSKGTSSAIVATTGWAVATSTLPIQAVVQYRYAVNGVPQQGVAALATAPSLRFQSPANLQTGVALANVYSASSVTVYVSALNAAGVNVATTSVTLPAAGHASFSVSQAFPSLPSNFRGTIIIYTDIPDTYTVALTLSVDLGVLASYPPAGLNWPISQYERIWKVWLKVLGAANAVFPGTSPKLVIDTSTGQINSFASPSLNEVDIFMNLAELISDSESELGFAIGHEIGHIIQAKTGLLFNSNKEYDADMHGMLLALLAGYDPYGAAGVLAKGAMASGNANLVNQQFDNIELTLGIDPHGSFVDRLGLIFTEMVQVCNLPQAQGFCGKYKSTIHPHFPGSAPL